MKEIELTRGAVALVDDEDFEELNKYNWHCLNTGYAARHRLKSELLGGNKTSIILMHQQIMGEPPLDMEIDHHDRNSLNNQRVNLRFLPHRENTLNVAIRATNTSGFRGVSFDKSRNKWEAYINVNAKKIHLGRFENKQDAADAYDKAALKYFQSFAQLNSEIALQSTDIFLKNRPVIITGPRKNKS